MEMSIEVADASTSTGLGRNLIAQARGTVPPGQHLFAAVSPGNARSLRAFLAAGFTPIGSEIIIDRSRVTSPDAN
jgi:L-amino acid N-acyltransferase YncA